jgi:hypothetical protein
VELGVRFLNERDPKQVLVLAFAEKKNWLIVTIFQARKTVINDHEHRLTHLNESEDVQSQQGKASKSTCVQAVDPLECLGLNDHHTQRIHKPLII